VRIQQKCFHFTHIEKKYIRRNKWKVEKRPLSSLSALLWRLVVSVRISARILHLSTRWKSPSGSSCFTPVKVSTNNRLWIRKRVWTLLKRSKFCYSRLESKRHSSDVHPVAPLSLYWLSYSGFDETVICVHRSWISGMSIFPSEVAVVVVLR
jgi:hypothetical protein